MTDFVDYTMRGGSHPDKEIDAVEVNIMHQAFQDFVGNPRYQEKGLRWTYNWTYFSAFYWTQNPELLKIHYTKKMQPHYLEIEVSTFCNLKCKMCEHTHWKEKNKNMTFEEFKHIVDQFPQLKWIGLTGIGESYCNPEFPKMMDYIKKKGIYIENFDNFIYMNEENAQHLVDIKMDKLYVSLDASTKETYEKLREGSSWDKVIEGIKRLDKLKREANSPWPEFWFHMIVSSENIHEMVPYLDMIDSLGVDCKRVQFTQILHTYPEIEGMEIGITDEQKDAVMKRAAELGLRVGFNVNTVNKKDMKTCSAWSMPFIFVDGTVIACCSQNEQNDRPFQVRTALGNVLKEDINVIWERFEEMKAQNQRGEVPANCERCILYKQGGCDAS